jgi:hypothetical protein
MVGQVIATEAVRRMMIGFWGSESAVQGASVPGRDRSLLSNGQKLDKFFHWRAD